MFQLCQGPKLVGVSISKRPESAESCKSYLKKHLFGI